MIDDYFYLLKNDIKSGPYPYRYIKDGVLDNSIPAEQQVLYEDRWISAQELLRLKDGISIPSAVEAKEENNAEPEESSAVPSASAEATPEASASATVTSNVPIPTSVKVTTNVSTSTFTEVTTSKTSSPPRPKVNTATPAPPPVYKPASSFESNKTPIAEPEEEVHFEFEEDLEEEGVTRLYRKAQGILFYSFGFAIPLIGLLISYSCWQKTRIWKDAFNEHNPNMTNKMVSCATKVSFAFFVCACIMAFTCLTGIRMPLSIGILALITPLIGIAIIPMTISIHLLCKFLMEEDFDIYESLLIAVRSITANAAFFMMNLTILGGVLSFSLGWVFFGVTFFAIWSSMNVFHSSTPTSRVVCVAVGSGMLAALMLKGLVSLFL